MAIQVPKVIELDTGEIEITITITVKPKKQQVTVIENPVDIAEDIKQTMRGVLTSEEILADKIYRSLGEWKRL